MYDSHEAENDFQQVIFKLVSILVLFLKQYKMLSNALGGILKTKTIELNFSTFLESSLLKM